MKKLWILLWICIGLPFPILAQENDEPKDTSQPAPGVLIVPFQGMMYFSDADQDIARSSKMNERQVGAELTNKMELNIYHQLLAHFNAISLKRSTSLNGEEDLRRIYAATRYTLYSRSPDQTKVAPDDGPQDAEADALVKTWNKKTKEQRFWVNDTAVMLGSIQSDEVFKYLYKKHHAKYILFLTQFEINTNNKNSIEWTTQKYKHTYTLHYNLYHQSGRLLRAETLILQGDNENRLELISQKVLPILAQKLDEIMIEVER
ncbi:MAG: hypothetical protein WC760_13515 [Bacteroidia bacterium]|jgi:hypothetical protein